MFLARNEFDGANSKGGFRLAKIRRHPRAIKRGSAGLAAVGALGLGWWLLGANHPRPFGSVDMHLPRVRLGLVPALGPGFNERRSA